MSENGVIHIPLGGPEQQSGRIAPVSSIGQHRTVVGHSQLQSSERKLMTATQMHIVRPGDSLLLQPEADFVVGNHQRICTASDLDRVTDMICVPMRHHDEIRLHLSGRSRVHRISGQKRVNQDSLSGDFHGKRAMAIKCQLHSAVLCNRAIQRKWAQVRLPNSQIGLHVPLVRFHPGLTVGIRTDEASFDNRRQHQHLEQLAEGMFTESGQLQVGCRSTGLGIRLIGPCDGCIEDSRQGGSSQLIQTILIQPMRRNSHGSQHRRPGQKIGNQLIPTTFLMLLTATVQISSVHDSERGGATFMLAQTFAEQLIVPQADRFKATAPGGQHTAVHAVISLKGMADSNELQHHILLEWGPPEVVGQRRRPLQQGPDIETGCDSR
jgi:hypothetical protein